MGAHLVRKEALESQRRSPEGQVVVKVPPNRKDPLSVPSEDQSQRLSSYVILRCSTLEHSHRLA